MDYSNSKKSRETPEASEAAPPKDIKQLVDSEVKLKEKGLGHKFKRVFFGGEFKSAARYIVGDVLLPAARNAVVDATTKGIERMVYGEEPRRSPRGPHGFGHVQYNRPGSVMVPDQPPRNFQPRTPARESKLAIFGVRSEAEGVLDYMNEIVSQYGVVSVADMNVICGHPSAAVDNKWGWSNLTGANVRQTREGYVLEFPPLEEI